MKVAHIMTRDPQSVGPETSLDEAMGIMDQGGMRHLPVVDQGRLVGVLSDRDLLLATGWLSTGNGLSDWSERDTGVVGDVMHRDVVTISPEDSVVTLSIDVVLRGIGCMPVVDDDRLVGIVTETDLLRAFVRAAREGLLSGDYDPPLSSYMSSHPATVGRRDPMSDAIELARKKHVRHLPVVDEGKLVGILSDRDLRGAVGRGVLDEQPVEDLMTEFVTSLRSDAPVTSAAQVMAEEKISSLPIVDAGQLVGIVTTTDLVEHCTNTLWEPDGFRRPELEAGTQGG